MVKLYRFQPQVVPGDDRLSSLQQGKVWFSDPKGFNDPMDMQLTIRDLTDRWSVHPDHKSNMKKALIHLMGTGEHYGQHYLFTDETLRIFKDWGQDTLLPGDSEENQLAHAVKSSIDNFGVCCLTPRLENILMWAHYANSGRGFCIEYTIDWEKIPRDILYLPVQYLSELDHLCISEALFTPHQFLNRALATKHADWSYEREIRLVNCKAKAAAISVSEPFMKITGLIAGLAMPTPLQEQLIAKARSLNVSAYKMANGISGELKAKEIH